MKKLYLIAMLLCFCAINAQAQTQDFNKIWTTVGSDGTVDETDASKVFFNRSVVQMGSVLIGNQPAAGRRASILPQTQSAVIRYNVTPVDGLFTPRPPAPSSRGIQLRLRFLDTGNSAQVVAKLIEVDLATGVETARLTFNSNDFAAANSYQVQFKGECGSLWSFDFKGKAYYIEAILTLTRSRFVGNAAGIQMIKLDNDICLG